MATAMDLRPLGESSSPELARVEARLDRIEAALDRIPDLVATATDAVDDLARRLGEGPAGLDERARAASSAVERLTRPDTLARLESILAKADVLAEAVDALAQVPALAATAADTFDEIAGGLNERGVHLDERVKGAFEWLERITNPRVQDHLAAMLKVLEVTAEPAGRVAEKLADVTARPERVGLFGVMRAMRDPNVQMAVGQAMAVARAVGQAVEETNSPALLTAGEEN